MNAQNPDNVVIVGGGVAGWMAASYLKAAFGDRVSVTLLDPGVVEAVEEDEASLGDLGRFFDVLGLAEEDWMAACEATYELAVRYQDFSRPDHYFYLPFEQAREAGGFPLTEWWLHSGPSGRFDRDCFVAAWLCDAGRSPRASHSALPGTAPATGPYGYHFKGEALAGYLAGYAVERGVRRLTGEVLDVRLDERGWIDHVVTAGHEAVHGDLFVDCTGTAGLLLRRAQGAVAVVPALPARRRRGGARRARGHEGARHPALHDRHRAGGGLDPDRTAAQPDRHRLRVRPGVLHVRGGRTHAARVRRAGGGRRRGRALLADHRAQPDGVAAQLRRRRRGRRPGGAAADDAGVLHPPRAGAAGAALPGRRLAPAVAEGYNAAVAQELDGAREFLALLYQGTARDHTQYWRDAKTRPVPDGLAERIEHWRVRLPGAEYLPPCGRGVPAHAYATVLLGTGAIEVRPPTAVVLADDAVARAEFAAVRRTAQRLVETLPTQYDYLRRISA